MKNEITDKREFKDIGIQEIIGAVKAKLDGIDRYSIRKKIVDLCGYEMKGVYDNINKAFRFAITIEGGRPVSADVYWVGKRAYGFPRHVKDWFKLIVKSEPLSYLHTFCALLQVEYVSIIDEQSLDENAKWVLTVHPELSVLHQNSENIAEMLLQQIAENVRNKKELIATIQRIYRDVQIEAQFFISKKTAQIEKIIIKTHDKHRQLVTHYSFGDFNDEQIKISIPAGVSERDLLSIPIGALLMNFKPWDSTTSYWGWSEKTHCMMLDQSLQLIRNNDTAGRYRELYDGYPSHYNWQGGTPPKRLQPPYYNPKVPNDSEPGVNDHPLIVGTWAEDAWDSPRTRDLLYPSAIPAVYSTYRSTQHFGGEDIGLAHAWYFSVTGSPPPANGNYYMSARNWGWDGGQTGDEMNFKGAINAYNNYTYAGAKEAYLRLGHVMHLLQDIAQPDHAGRVDHASSGCDDPDAFNRYKVCPIVVGEAAIIAAVTCAGPCVASGPFYLFCLAGCITTAELVAFSICEAMIDSDEVGFEWLVREKWDFNQLSVLQHLKIEKAQGAAALPNPYDNYFLEIQNYSLAAAKAKNKALPLGLEYIDLTPFNLVPGLNPEIELGSHEEAEFLELADDVISKGTNFCAGLLQHFFEVVNHPPYVQEVVIYQGINRLRADEVTGKVFPTDPDKKPDANIKYRAWWVCKYNSQDAGKLLLHRELKIIKNEPLDRELYTYVLARVTSNMQTLEVNLRDDSGKDIDKATMVQVADTLTDLYASMQSVGSHEFPATAYYAAFFNRGILNVCGYVHLEFSGKDSEAHYINQDAGRIHSGEELDSNPVTIAVASSDFPHNWIDDKSQSRGYEPGIDKKHKARVFPPDSFETNDDWQNAAIISLDPSGKTVLELSFHDENDKDYFLIKFPLNPGCKGANLSSPGKVKKILPSWLQFHVESKWQDILVTILVNKVPQVHTFKAGSLVPPTPNPLIASAVSFIGIEDIFPDGEIWFMVEPKATSWGTKDPGCYILTVWSSECKI